MEPIDLRVAITETRKVKRDVAALDRKVDLLRSEIGEIKDLIVSQQNQLSLKVDNLQNSFTEVSARHENWTNAIVDLVMKKPYQLEKSMVFNIH